MQGSIQTLLLHPPTTRMRQGTPSQITRRVRLEPAKPLLSAPTGWRHRTVDVGSSFASCFSVGACSVYFAHDETMLHD
jgi:hypothetical protein